MSCHNSRQLKLATQLSVDFVTLSPILRTPINYKSIPIGWKKFTQMVRCKTLKVYPLGGLSDKDYKVALNYGAYGIAAKSAFWKDKK